MKEDGYRLNVGLIIANKEGKLLLCKRKGMNSWQFPQGGINADEAPEEAMYRELREEVGLLPEHVTLLGVTKGWHRYRLPGKFIRKNETPICIGQKQKWFLLNKLVSDSAVNLSASPKPEFKLISTSE